MLGPLLTGLGCLHSENLEGTDRVLSRQELQPKMGWGLSSSMSKTETGEGSRGQLGPGYHWVGVLFLFLVYPCYALM